MISAVGIVAIIFQWIGIIGGCVTLYRNWGSTAVFKAIPWFAIPIVMYCAYALIIAMLANG